MKLTAQIINEATKRLIATKKQKNLFNVAIDYQGLSWSMAITAYDNKSFPKKDVHITLHASGDDCFVQKVVKIITPKQAGYTLEQFMEYVPRYKKKD